jgi:subtilisin family serine protease
VKPKTLFCVLCLLLPILNVSADGEPAIRSAGDVLLTGAEDPAASKVYIVQLRSPATAVHYASVTKMNMATSMTSNKPMPRFEKNSAAVRSYAAGLDNEQQMVLSTAGPGTSQIYSYKYGLNGFAARMSVADARKLEDHPEVLNVWEDEVRPMATETSSLFLGLFDLDGGLRSEHGLDGDGIVIGIIDSGIAPEQPALQETRAADRPSACQNIWAETTLLGRWLCHKYTKIPDVLDFEEPEDWNGECEAGDQFDDTQCNNKLIGARWFIDGAENSGPIDENDFRSPRDADGHGTHTATTAAGNRSRASIFGTLIGDIEGMAPKARIAVYKACWLRPGESRASCNTSDLARAVDAAVADGVDIISYSIGSSMREITAPDDIALMAATKAGVIAVVAAGNDGPNLATIGSPAGAPWVITAAASSRTGDSSVEAFQVIAPSSIAAKYASKEALFSPPLADSGPIEGRLVLVDDDDATLPDGSDGVESDGCQALVNGILVAGNIALMQRSGCLFTDMVKNAEDAGAIAVLVYNIAGDPVVMFGESGLVDIPALMMGQADANLILAEMDANNRVNVVLEDSLLLSTPDEGDLMASFSSRGPGPVPDILKPDVTAPGVNILAGFAPDPANAKPNENFAYLSGTSMATPHVAGVAALLRQAHPDWSPAAIKSALVTSARQDLELPDNLTVANPFDYGGGHIVPNDALEPGLVYDVSDDEYDAFACGTASPAVTPERCAELSAAGYSKHARDLNQPSISVSRLASNASVTRHVTNVSEESETYSVEVSSPPGIAVVVTPPTISLGPSQSARFDVSLTYESGPLDLWRFGSLTWMRGDTEIRSSIAVKPASITAPGEIVSYGGTGSETFPVQFGYDGSYSPGVHGLNLPLIQRRFVDNDPTKTFTRRTDSGVTEHALIVPPNQLFLRFSLFDALTDGDDDLDMYVYYCGEDGSACSRIGESGGPTSAEEFNLIRPAPGTYGVYIHGFETDEISGGPGANYELLSWSIGNFDDKGNMSASGPPFVAAGTVIDITVNWSELLSDTIYLGGISHNTPQGLSELTIITIGN